MRLLLFLCGSAGLFLAAQSSSAAIMGSADMTYQSLPGNTYHYDLTLHNAGDTAIGTFWYAWDDSNLNFLPSIPNNIIAPSGWYGFYTYSYDPSTAYTYGIEWYTFSPLAAGASLSGFSFESPDTPATLSGISNVPPVNPGDPSFSVGQSFVYGSYPAPPPGDAGYQFVVAPVPEPATSALCALTVCGSLVLRRRS